MRLKSLIFFVTNKCNSKCKTCFYWKNLNKNNELTLNEIKKISGNLGWLGKLFITGGEPFLRKDLYEIIRTFYSYNATDHVLVSTNGMLTERIIEVIGKLLKLSYLKISVHISIDGVEEEHDKIRGVKGNYKKVLKTIDGLKRIKYDYEDYEYDDRLEVNVSTTVCKDNYKNLWEIFEEVKKLGIDHHGFELIRGDPKNSSLKKVDMKMFEKYRMVSCASDLYYTRKKHTWLVSKYLNVKKQYFYEMQEKALFGGRWEFPCSACKNMMVLYEDGRLGPCELLPVYWDLKKYNYNINDILVGSVINVCRRHIKTCSCTHCVFLYDSIDSNWFISYVKIPWRMLT